MSYDFKGFEAKMAEVKDWLKREFSNIRTGRASVGILDSIAIEAYGTRTPINQTSNLSVEDAKTLRIAPWDKTLVQSIEKAIMDADLGVSTSVDAEGVRVIFPALTTESRQKFAKQAKTKLEDAKVSIRNERNQSMKEIEKGKKDGSMPADDAKRSEDQIQKIVDQTNKDLEDLFRNKESEIMND